MKVCYTFIHPTFALCRLNPQEKMWLQMTSDLKKYLDVISELIIEVKQRNWMRWDVKIY